MGVYGQAGVGSCNIKRKKRAAYRKIAIFIVK